MCGVIGYISNKTFSLDKFKYYRDLMYHRGPDQSGIWHNECNNIILGHRRLSIIDLTNSGSQPMTSSCGRFTIVFNGEIYNYIEIRNKLLKLGYIFNSSSDTEVIINAYKEWGKSCLDLFNGMFSFAILDQGNESSDKSIFIGRDRFGKKPLYYYHKDHTLIFASELKSIPKEFRGSFNLDSINNYLSLGYVAKTDCILNNVKKLQAGCALKFSLITGELKLWQWWKLPTYQSNNILDIEEAAYNIEKLIINSIRIRLRSDVPIGVLLSGGLDSSLIAAIASNLSESKIKTFTFGQADKKLDESKYAKIIANKFETDHTVLEADSLDPKLFDDLKKYIDEPIADSSIIPTYLISRLTSQNVKVALGGDGGDEIFAGYHSYQSAIQNNSLMQFCPNKVLRVASDIAAYLPLGLKGRNKIMSFKEGSFKTQIWGTSFFDTRSRKNLFNLECLKSIKNINSPEIFLLDLFGKNDNQVENMIRMDIQSQLVDDFLFKIDRASMASSLEVRSPFLDKDLSEYVFKNLTTDLKVNYNSSRIIQKKIAKNILPKKLDIDRKQGFSIPIDDWLKKSNTNWKEEILDTNHEFLKKEEVINLIRGFEKGRRNGSRIFSLLMLNTSINNLGYL